jgi:hypothetical protein
MSDSPADRTGGRGPFAKAGGAAGVERLLADRAGHPRIELDGERCARIVAAVRSAPVMYQAERGRGWVPAAIAAGLLLVVGAAAWQVVPREAPAPAGLSMASLGLPVGPEPMMRLVAGSMDRPLRDEAERMVADTRRATRAVAGCVPFVRQGF